MIPFISWGAKWCSIQSLHIIILSRKNDFPNIQSLTMPILSQARGLLCGQRRIWAPARRQNRREKALKHTMRACGWWYPRAWVKKSGKKIRINFSPISDELTVNQVGWGRFVNLQVSEINRKANEAQMREEFIPSPSMVANLFALFSSMCEQKVSAYMPSWALLVMTAVW